MSDKPTTSMREKSWRLVRTTSVSWHRISHRVGEGLTSSLVHYSNTATSSSISCPTSKSSWCRALSKVTRRPSMTKTRVASGQSMLCIEDFWSASEASAGARAEVEHLEEREMEWDRDLSEDGFPG